MQEANQARASCLGASEVDQLEAEIGRVDQKVVGFEVSVADAFGVDVLKRSESLLHVGAHLPAKGGTNSTSHLHTCEVSGELREYIHRSLHHPYP